MMKIMMKTIIPDIFVYAADYCRSWSADDILEISLYIVLSSLMIIISFSSVLHADSITSGRLPLEAGICISQAGDLAKKGKIKKAVDLLENFKAKKNKADELTARKRGYTHYYIDFMLGNYYMALAGHVPPDNPGLKKQYRKKAADSYRNAVAKNPDLSPGWLNLAKCLYESKQMSLAAKAFVKGYETGKKKDGVYLYYASICFAEAKDNKNAIKYAVFLTKKYPLEPRWWKALSSLYLRNNQLKKGLAALVSCGFLTPLNHNEISLAADLYQSLDIPLKAAFFYEKLLHEKKNKKTINKIVYAYMQANDTEKAIKWIDKGLVLYQSDKDLLKKRAAVKAMINFDKQQRQLLSGFR